MFTYPKISGISLLLSLSLLTGLIVELSIITPLNYDYCMNYERAWPNIFIFPWQIPPLKTKNVYLLSLEMKTSQGI